MYDKRKVLIKFQAEEFDPKKEAAMTIRVQEEYSELI